MADNTQSAPWPTDLQRLVDHLHYRPGWTFDLRKSFDRGQGSVGLTLDVVSKGYNSRHPEQGQNYYVHHFVPVPPAAYDYRSWRRWLLDRLLEIERHEAMEFFQLKPCQNCPEGAEAEFPFAPSHYPGADPYTVIERGSWEDADTSFLGVRNNPDG